MWLVNPPHPVRELTDRDNAAIDELGGDKAYGVVRCDTELEARRMHDEVMQRILAGRDKQLGEIAAILNVGRGS